MTETLIKDTVQLETLNESLCLFFRFDVFHDDDVLGRVTGE